MAEWSIAAVLKTVELRGSGGSNPSLSATKKNLQVLLVGFFIIKNEVHSLLDALSIEWRYLFAITLAATSCSV